MLYLAKTVPLRILGLLCWKRSSWATRWMSSFGFGSESWLLVTPSAVVSLLSGTRMVSESCSSVLGTTSVHSPSGESGGGGLAEQSKVDGLGSVFWTSGMSFLSNGPTVPTQALKSSRRYRR